MRRFLPLPPGALSTSSDMATWLLAAVPYVVFTLIAVVDFFVELHPYVKITSFVLEAVSTSVSKVFVLAIWLQVVGLPGSVGSAGIAWRRSTPHPK